MLTIRLLERVRDVAKRDWDALVPEDASPFVEWTWLDCLEEAGCVDVGSGAIAGNTNWLARHFAIFRDDRLVAAAPAYLKTGSEGEFVFDFSWADLAQRLGVPYYPKIVLAVPFTPVTGPRVLTLPGEDRNAMVALVADLAQQLAREIGAGGVHVLFPGDDEAAAWEKRGFLRRSGFQYHWFRGEDASFDDYLARFKSKKRNQLKREAAQAAKNGIRVETLAPSAITPDVVAQIFRFYASTVDRYFYGNRYLNESFFQLVAERFRDRLAWVVAREAGGGAIAGAFNVQKGNRLFGRYWGAEAALPFLHFDVCYYHGIKRCLAERLDVFEPGAGGEHKRARGFVPTMTHSAHWLASPRMRAILEPHLLRERAHVAEIVAEGEEDGTA